MTPSPSLLTKLSRSKLLTRWAVASTGVGERRSRAKGAGMEFAEHREYQPGDDLRHLDPHLHARFGKNYIRQYEVYQQLPVTILVDASRSMDFGSPGKFAVAKQIAALLGFVGLVGGDQVQIGIGTGDRVHWSSRYHGAMRAQPMFAWLERQQAEERGGFDGALRSIVGRLVDRGLLIVISDWWEKNLESELAMLVASGQEIWGVQVLAREELEPTLLGQGEVRFVDMESGDEVELAIDRDSSARYQRAISAVRDRIETVLARSHGHYLLVPTDRDPERLILDEWRARALID